MLPEVHAGQRRIWADTAAAYPPLLAAGQRVDRAHDLGLTERLLLGYLGRPEEPHAPAAALARRDGRPVPADPTPVDSDAPATLFAPDPPDPAVQAEQWTAVHADQQRRIAATAEPGRFTLLVAAESAGALAAAEMNAVGLPWRTDRHEATLSELLGPRPAGGGRPPRLAALAEQVRSAFGGREVNPDSPAEVLAAFTAAGHEVSSTRSWVLRTVDHPAVEPLLAYKKLARIHAANGWTWQDRWVRDGRLSTGFVPGGVVSGRWATRGGGGLQLPKVLKGAVVADPGHRLVVADAGQLEPRLLAALSDDAGLRAAARAPDLYAAIARESFGGDRARAKLGLLGAMYGQTGGQAAAPLATLRRRYPDALALLEDAARAGERGLLVRSHLGRTCPPASDQHLPDGPKARARGRFTRNFVVQATAAEWALSWLALTRTALASLPGAELVFFVHDELVVHTPAELAAPVAEVVRAAGGHAGRLLFGSGTVPVPLDVTEVDCYADAG